jgi:hypothetical protein
MAEQWIDAASAAKLVMDGPAGAAGRHSLCARAHRGLVQTKARLLVLEDKELVSRQEQVAIPPEFWWAEGEATLEQNWVAGDFTTQLESGTRVQAFGVTFAMNGLVELLSPEKRALAARSLSVAGNSAWLPAREARRFAYEKAGFNPKTAHMALVDQARLGFITGRAVLAQRFDPGQYGIQQDGPPAWEEREWDIPDGFWRDFKVTQRTSFDWERGIFSGEGPWRRGRCVIKLSGVYFLKESLSALLPISEISVAAEDELDEETSKPKGGRPPQAWWDDMIVAVAGLILHGQLKPTRQAQVTDAMLTWAALNGHDISESAVKPKAKKLFEAYQKEGRNFLDGRS